MAGSSSSISQVATNPSSSNSSGASQSSSLSVSLSPKDDSFVKRLIEAVKEQPCLYNPNHEHYGNKHSSVQYKSRIWQKLCHDLGYTEDAHSLQIQWKRIRDRYVRERRKRRNAINTDINANQTPESALTTRERHPSGGSTCSTSSGNTNSAVSRHYEMMRWLEPYIADTANSNANADSSNTPSNTSTSAQPNNATAGSTTPNASTLQSSQQTISSAQKMPVPKEETLSCFMSEPDLASQDANASVVVSTSEDGVLLNSYDQPANSQSTTPQQAAIQSVNAPPAHHDYATVQQRSAAVLPNGSNTPSNSNTKKNNQKSTTGPPSTTGSPCSSTTSSEIDVGSVTTFSNHQPQTQQITSPHQSNMLVLTPVSQQQRPAPTQQIVYTKTDPQPAIGEPIHTDDGSVVTVTARGTAPVATILKKDLNIRTNDGGTLTMFIDPTTFYQHGSQKMYRLVNVSELNAADMAALTNASNVTTVNNVSTNNDVKVLTSVPIRRKRLAPTSSASGISNGRGQLGDDLILDDGISEKTVTIDQTSQSSLANDRLLMDQHVVTVGSPNVLLTQPNIHQVHHQAHAGTSQQHGGLNASGHHTITQHIPSNTGQLSTVQIRQQSAQQVSSQQHQSSTQRYTIAQTAPTITIQQPQYTILSSHPIQTQTDADIAFANSIASHLSRLNEDEKAVAKMNIQRILMDARFGMGACARMIHDEELNEASSNANHQVINVNVTHQRQQHVDGGASGR